MAELVDPCITVTQTSRSVKIDVNAKEIPGIATFIVTSSHPVGLVAGRDFLLTNLNPEPWRDELYTVSLEGREINAPFGPVRDFKLKIHFRENVFHILGTGCSELLGLVCDRIMGGKGSFGPKNKFPEVIVGCDQENQTIVLVGTRTKFRITALQLSERACTVALLRGIVNNTPREELKIGWHLERYDHQRSSDGVEAVYADVRITWSYRRPVLVTIEGDGDYCTVHPLFEALRAGRELLPQERLGIFFPQISKALQDLKNEHGPSDIQRADALDSVRYFMDEVTHPDFELQGTISGRATLSKPNWREVPKAQFSQDHLASELKAATATAALAIHKATNELAKSLHTLAQEIKKAGRE